MKSAKRLLAALLAALMLASTLAACSSGDSAADNTAETTAATEAVETEPLETGRADVKDDLPDDLDFNGSTITIFTPNNNDQNVYFGGDLELSGDVVNDAVMERNLAVEERLNIKLEHIPREDANGGDYPGIVTPLILAGDTTYDVYMGPQYAQAKIVANGGFYNLYDLEHINFSQPWWWENYMTEISLGNDTRYFMVGDYFINTLQNTRTVFYNKSMYNDYFGSPDGLYDIVFDGTWTIDKMAEQARSVWTDLDNDGTTRADDQLGYITYYTGSAVDAFVYATDVKFYYRDEDGRIILDMYTEKATTLAEKIVGIFYQEGSYFKNNDEFNRGVFSEGRALFLGNATLGIAEKLREMEQDFGMVPYPKYDENQEHYNSLVHDGALIGAVNGCSENIEILGAVLEALNAESYRYVTPAWYDIALKVKYSRDDISSQMIDIIQGSITTSFIFAYNYALNGIGLVYRTLATKNDTNYVSAVEAIDETAQVKLDELYDLFVTNN